jgi:hypothetical protein
MSLQGEEQEGETTWSPGCDVISIIASIDLGARNGMVCRVRERYAHKQHVGKTSTTTEMTTSPGCDVAFIIVLIGFRYPIRNGRRLRER